MRANGDASATAAIASISDQDWHISRTHGVYHIPARPQGEPYALVMITSRGDALDLGDNPFTISARDIAEDLLQDLREHGIFVCAGDRPSVEELASAIRQRDAYYHQLISEGDTIWARGHCSREISDLHRRAAIAFGEEREWAYVPTRFADCPACGEKVKPSVAVCKHCGAILDAEKAAKHGLGATRRCEHEYKPIERYRIRKCQCVGVKHNQHREPATQNVAQVPFQADVGPEFT
jgi:hypothetical protein